MRHPINIVIFQDKLGITEAYRFIWEQMLLKAGILSPKIRFIKVKSYDHFHQSELLMWKGNRKSPGFIEDPGNQIRLLNWVKKTLMDSNAEFALFMDPALFFIVNQKWEQATSELLRGGMYEVKLIDRNVPILVTVPISSVNRQMKPKDIAALNNGFADYEDWKAMFDPDDEFDSDDDTDETSEVNQMEWYSPVIVPFGKFCLQMDLFKLRRWIKTRNEMLERTIEHQHNSPSAG